MVFSVMSALENSLCLYSLFLCVSVSGQLYWSDKKKKKTLITSYCEMEQFFVFFPREYFII